VARATDRGPDHRAFDVLRAAWCRSLTGEVLLLGRTGYPYVAVDRDEPGALVDLLTGAQGELRTQSPTRLRKVLRRDQRPAAAPAALPPDPDDTAVNLLGVLRGR
jgi:hypothetical protein